MKTSTALGVAFGALVLATALLFFEAFLLGLILFWFGVYLSFWQNLVIVLLANLIFNSNASTK